MREDEDKDKGQQWGRMTRENKDATIKKRLQTTRDDEDKENDE